jgi:hypothetical protein
LAAFRQAVYTQVFTARRDALFELLDALLLGAPGFTLADLALSPSSQRAWPSAYAALEDGRCDAAALRRLLVAQLPKGRLLFWALDGTTWPRPRARTLPDRQYCHSPTPAVLAESVVVGRPYSLVAYVPEAHASWAPPLAADPITPDEDAISVGLAQLRSLWALRPADAGPWIVAADGRYSTVRFWQAVGPIVGQAGGVVTRLRYDRVLYRRPGPYQGRGAPRKHGPRFACADAASWGEPDAAQLLNDERWGQVRLRYWANLHDRRDHTTEVGVLQVEVHREAARPPPPLWLAWQGAAVAPELIWRGYEARWSIEPSIHFRKADLGWTEPRLQTLGAMDNWTGLVDVAEWIVYLAREMAAAKARPWQRVAARPTPGQVRAGLGAILWQVGSPVRPPKPRGKAAGWPVGRVRARRERLRVVKKGPGGSKKRRKRSRGPPKKV